MTPSSVQRDHIPSGPIKITVFLNPRRRTSVKERDTRGPHPQVREAVVLDRRRFVSALPARMITDHKVFRRGRSGGLILPLPSRACLCVCGWTCATKRPETECQECDVEARARRKMQQIQRKTVLTPFTPSVRLDGPLSPHVRRATSGPGPERFKCGAAADRRRRRTRNRVVLGQPGVSTSQRLHGRTRTVRERGRAGGGDNRN